jgi:hypothetical protein
MTEVVKNSMKLKNTFLNNSFYKTTKVKCLETNLTTKAYQIFIQKITLLGEVKEDRLSGAKIHHVGQETWYCLYFTSPQIDL